MTTASEEILNRYKKGETIADDLGRLITVRRLRPSQNVAIMRLAGADGMHVVGSMLTAAAVSKIDEDLFPLPKTIEDINEMIDRLDLEGIKAADQALQKLLAGVPEAPKADDGAAAKSA